MIARILLPLLVTLALPARVLAQSAESERHFDRGVALWDQRDFKNALVELRRSYELDPRPGILYNVACAEAQLDHPVEAVAAFDQVLGDADKLPPEKVARARRAREEQASHIGQLLVKSNVDAELTLDGAAIGATPMRAALPVGRGTHWLWARAAGHAPHLDKVEIVGGQTLEMPINLVPMAEGPAFIVIDSPVPGAEVVLDGNVVGRTPLGGSLPVAPGAHEVGLRRAGFEESRTSLTVAPGGSRTLALAPAELSSTASSTSTGVVDFAISEPDASVEINGRPRPDYRQGLRLPAGIHQLTVTRSGFFPVQREIVSDASSINTVRVKLEPTEETRMSWVGHANSQSRWAWATIAAGAALGGTATYFFLHNRSELRGAQVEFDEVKGMLGPGGQCSSMFELTEHCQQLVDTANDRLDRAQRTRQVSLIGMGVGGAVLATGVVLRLLADDPHRYDFERADPERGPDLRLLAGVQPGLALVGVAGRFR